MSYVFHNVFYSSSSIKAANDIIDLMKRTSGSEMREEDLPVYIAKLKEEIEKGNNTGRHARIALTHIQSKHFTDKKVHGQISVYTLGREGKKDIARLDYIQVSYGWRIDTQNVLYMYPFTERLTSLP